MTWGQAAQQCSGQSSGTGVPHRAGRAEGWMRRGAAQAAMGRTGAVVVAARWPDCGASFSFWGGAGGLGCRGVLAAHMRSAPAHLELAFQGETISRAKSSSISSTSRLIVRVGSFQRSHPDGEVLERDGRADQAAEDMAKQLVRVPLLKPDEATITAAVDAGKRIGILATIPRRVRGQRCNCGQSLLPKGAPSRSCNPWPGAPLGSGTPELRRPTTA